MTNKKITDLVELTTPTTDDVFPLVDIATNSTKKAQLANLPISTATQTALDAKQATLVSGTNIKTINSTSLLGSGDISVVANPAGTAGQIQFTDGSAFAADSNLFWDNTNKRLGVGTSSPIKPITIYGSVGVVGANEGITFNNTSGTTEYGSLKLNAGTGESRWYTNNSYFPTIYSSGQEVVRINTSQQMGVGTTSPTARLQVKGSGSTSATTSLLVQNSSGTELFAILDDGSTRIGKAGGNVSFGPGTSNTLQNGYNWLGNYNALGTWNMGGATTEATAIVNIQSTTKGFLPPRMTTTQKNAIASPASGLMVYDTTTNKLCCYNGTSWNDLF